MNCFCKRVHCNLFTHSLSIRKLFLVTGWEEKERLDIQVSYPWSTRIRSEMPVHSRIELEFGNVGV